MKGGLVLGVINDFKKKSHANIPAVKVNMIWGYCEIHKGIEVLRKHWKKT